MSDATSTPSSKADNRTHRPPSADKASAGMGGNQPSLNAAKETVGPPPPGEPLDAPKAAAPRTSGVDAEPGSTRPESHFGLVRSDQLVVAALVLAAIVLMAIHWIRLSGWGLRPVEISRLPQHRYDYQIDVNSATWVEWTQLEGIGETLAQRIIDDREQNGPYRRIDDLTRVKGLGPKTLEKLRPWLKVYASEPAAAPSGREH